MSGAAMVGFACRAMPLVPSFAMAKLLFSVTGASFGLIKVSVYSSIGLVTDGPAHHASLTNVIEGLFMVGVLSGYWIFGAFIDPAQPASLGWLDVYWLLAGFAFCVCLLLAYSKLDESSARPDRKSAV